MSPVCMKLWYDDGEFLARGSCAPGSDGIGRIGPIADGRGRGTLTPSAKSKVQSPTSGVEEPSPLSPLPPDGRGGGAWWRRSQGNSSLVTLGWYDFILSGF